MPRAGEKRCTCKVGFVEGNQKGRCTNFPAVRTVGKHCFCQSCWDAKSPHFTTKQTTFGALKEQDVFRVNGELYQKSILGDADKIAESTNADINILAHGVKFTADQAVEQVVIYPNH